MNEAEDESQRADDRLGRGISWLLGACGAGGLFTLAATIAQRMGSRYPLEWMEGASLQHALWLARGELPYAAPSAELIAYVYPPLAYAPMALASALFGASLPVARAVSVACTIATLLLLGLASARLARSPIAGVLSAGLFACGFGYGGAFLDLVRVDACFLLCIAAAAERLTARRNAAALYWLAASALAKQHGAVLLLAVSIVLLVRERKQVLRAVVLAWSALGAACAALEVASGGWFLRYTLALPAGHGLEPWLLVSFVLIDLLVYLPVLSIAAGLALVRNVRAPSALDALLLAAIAVAALGRAHPGGDDNVRLPALLLLCLAGVTPIVAKVLHGGSRAEAEAGKPSSTPSRVVLALAVCAQAALLWQPPSLHAPRSEHAVQRFAALEAALARCARGGTRGGTRVVALDYALLTGEPFIHTMALSDLRLTGDTALARAGTRALLDALRAPDAPRALAVGETFAELQAVLDKRYEHCEDVPAPRLPTGYQPGVRLDRSELHQRIYALRD
jgi:hypothetical protein